ncbi:MAG: ribosomal protein [Dehalococcoidia bacterium]|nr:ribosomal protein [Dehalococcoidia bacterium]
MPTPQKEKQVEEIKERLGRSTIAVAIGYQGLTGSVVTGLRRHLREQGVEYKVVKNTLALRAARELGREKIVSVLKGPTAMAFGYGDEVAVARAISSYVSSTRIPLVIHGAMMGSTVLTAEQVGSLALLPPRDELVARLIGQMQAPMAGLVNALNGILKGFVVVLQRRVEQLEPKS